MGGKCRFKEIIKKSYNEQAALYAECDEMQTTNLKNLLNYFFNCKFNLVEGRLLDLGCGTGTFIKKIQNIKEIKHKLNINKIKYHGIDLSYELLKEGKRKIPNNVVIVGDAECLPFKEESFDIVISNSVLHWLNVPESNHTPKQALREVFRVLNVNRPLAISVSGIGTAKRFQHSYRKIMATYKNEEWFDKSLFRPDPIGSMKLKDLKKIMTDIGYKIKKAKKHYEPVDYKDGAGKYIAQVEAYGKGMYLAPIPEDKREKVWAEIKDDFIKAVGDTNYCHDQYIIYIIALKKYKLLTFFKNFIKKHFFQSFSCY